MFIKKLFLCFTLSFDFTNWAKMFFPDSNTFCAFYFADPFGKYFSPRALISHNFANTFQPKKIEIFSPQKFLSLK